MDCHPCYVRFLLLVGLFLAFAGSADAVVVSTTRETTVAPEVDFGWNNLGILRNSTAVYLGDRWVLSAAHVGIGSVTFPDRGTFEADMSTLFRLENAPGSGLSKPADLILFQLNEDPGLPPIEIASSTPDVGTQVWLAGHGLDSEDEFTDWDVRQQGAKWIWTETSPPGEYRGIKTNGPGILRWGTNLIEDDETFKNDFDDDILVELKTNTSETLTILTEFDDDESNSDHSVKTPEGSSATAYEAQAVLSDSGGGVFRQVDDRWQLTGTLLSVEGHRNQPDVTRNAIFGNLTYIADLASYADQIRSRVRFGDFDSDQVLTVADVDALMQAMNQPEVDARFDLDRDDDVTEDDLDIWVVDLFGSYSGDANLDGQFDTADLILVLQGGTYEDDLTGNSTWATGDWDGDGEFGSSDLIVSLQQGGYETGPRVGSDQTPNAVSVPEPSTPLLVYAMMAAWAFAARRPLI